MKQILSISSVFIGLVIGAGFASGREIFEYFSIPSRTDLTGIVIATIGFGAICYVIMDIAQKYRAENFDNLINRLSGRLAPAIRIFMTAFMFCGFFIMMSACGVLSKETFGISSQYGIWLLAFVCFTVFSFDIKGLVAFNAVLVPLMVLGMLVVCAISAFTYIPVFSALEGIKANPLISALCYVSYNTITAGAVLVPLSVSASKKRIAAASAVSSLVLGLLIYIAWLCMNLYFDPLLVSEMPLLELAAKNSSLTKKLYALVLFMALCTTAVSQGFGILSKFNFSKTSSRILSSAALCLLAMPFANFGFSALVSNLYSTFGYMGLLWTGLVLWGYVSRT